MNPKSAMISIGFAVLAGGSTVSQAAPRPLQVAQTACPAHDFESFFAEFIESSAVRRRYTGSTIEVGSIAAPRQRGTVQRANPERFDITMFEYNYADTASVERWEKNRTPYVDLTLDWVKVPGGGWRITYQQAVMRDDGVGDGKTLVRKIGKPRAYIFAPEKGCWKLVRWLK